MASVSLLTIILIKTSMSQVTFADNNFLTGSNDIVAVIGEDGDFRASPFSVQFGKKDIWLPRSGHVVSLEVNSLAVPVSMVLDSAGRGYFPPRAGPGAKKQYRFWSALLGVRDPEPKLRTSSATHAQLDQLGLRSGVNSLEYRVETSTGTVVTSRASIFLLNSTAKIVVSDIDGTVTKSDVRGYILPALGLDDWKHEGVVKLYQKINDQGYTLLYLTNRAIGQSAITREYLFSLEEAGAAIPPGPLFLQVESLVGALQTEVIDGQPELNKIVALSKIRGLFPQNPFVSGFGNKEWDILAYKAVGIEPDMIYNVMEDSSIVVEGSGVKTSYGDLISNVTSLFP